MKYAIWPGEEFYENMLSQARTEGERAVCMLLWRTGMHSSTLVSGAYTFQECDGRHSVHWRRTKTSKRLRATIKGKEVRLIRRVLTAGSLPATQRALRWWVRAIGDRAGYAEQAVSPLTFRHSRAVWLLDGKMPLHRVAAVLGCSYSTLEKHYAQLEADNML